MKIILKIAVLGLALSANTLIGLEAGKKTTTKKALQPVKKFTNDDEFLRDAASEINAIKSKYSAEGKIDRIEYTYEVAGKFPIKTKAKVYFAEYRMQSQCLPGKLDQSFLDKEVDKVIKIIYKEPDRDHLSVVGINPKKHTRIFSRAVSMPLESLSA